MVITISPTRAQRRAYRSDARRASRNPNTPASAQGKQNAADVAFRQQHGSDFAQWAAAMLLRHGMPSYTRDTAVAHEAGHIIVALSLGATTTSAEIFEERPGIWLGWNDVSWPADTRPGRVIHALEEPTLAIHSLTYVLAGLAGEQVAGFDHQAACLDEAYEALRICLPVAHARRLDAAVLIEQLLASARGRIRRNAALFEAVCTQIDSAGLIDAETVARLKVEHGVEVTPTAALW